MTSNVRIVLGVCVVGLSTGIVIVDVVTLVRAMTFVSMMEPPTC